MTRALIVVIALLAACGPGSSVAPSATAQTATAAASPSPAQTASPSPSPTPSASPLPSPAPSATPGLLPIFDAHVHYSREAWAAYPPERVAALLDAAGVRTALVSSGPDEGTFRLRAILGDRIVPTLGPYRSAADVFSWTRDGTILPYLQSSYGPHVHRGFGEFHLNVGQVTLPVVRAALAFARDNDLFLHAHADARAAAELLDAVGPEYVVLWAHAGLTATPEQIDALLARWPKLWTELSLRDDVAPNGVLDPRWAALFAKYPERFMVGTDTWAVGGSVAAANERWGAYADIIRGIRAWLAQLPPEEAERVAHLNGERFLAQFP